MDDRVALVVVGELVVVGRRVSAFVSTVLLSVGLVGAVPARASAIGGDCSAGRVLNVVAHHDDDVLFLSPDLLKDLGDGGVCVRTVFLIGSYYSRGGATSDAQKYQYMEGRELGIRDAYQQASGVAGPWIHEPYAQGGARATAWSLGSRLSIIEMRLPDNAASNDAGTMRRGQLWALYANDTTAWTIPGPDSPEQRLSRDDLLAFLQGTIDEYRPTVINTVDPSADNQPALSDGAPVGDQLQRFHPDHVATTRLLVGALNRRGTPWPRITFYRDYQSQLGEPNLDPATAARKEAVFKAYALHDEEICEPGPAECVYRTDEYAKYQNRQYYADSAWRRGYLLPLPHGTESPRMNARYRLVNRATGHYLDVAGSSTADHTPVIAHPGTGNENQVFVLTAAQGGWNLRPALSGQCVDVPGSARDTTALIQYTCGANTDNPPTAYDTLRLNQAVRIQGDSAGGYRITFAHSGLLLTAPPVAGAAVTQAPATGSAAQLWDLVPA